MVGAKLLADLEAIVTGTGQDHRLGPQGLRHRDPEQADRPRSRHDHALSSDQSAEFRQAVHGRAGGHHQRGFLVRHGVGDMDQRVDVVDLVFAEAAIGGEAVGPVALVHVTVVLAVVVARGVHALAAALALAAAGVDLDGHALADLVLVDAMAERHDRAHVLMAGVKPLLNGAPPRISAGGPL